MAEKILLVDDDEEFRSEFKDFLEGYDIIEASDGREALKILGRANEINLVILDVMMPGLSGTDVLREIKRIDPNLGIIILTGQSSKDVAIEALKGHADDYIEKPLNPEKVREIIDKVLLKSLGECDITATDVNGKIEIIKRFVEKNCFKKIGLEDAANVVCLSPKYLSRIFKENTGVNFSEYRLKIKVEEAKKLLNRSGYNINQISEKLGYENAESFIRQFKNHTGYTPSHFRKKELLKKRAKRVKSKSR